MNWIITWDALIYSSSRNRNYRRSNSLYSNNHPENKSTEVVFKLESPPPNNAKGDGEFIFDNDDVAPPRENSVIPMTQTVTFESTAFPESMQVSVKRKKNRSMVFHRLLKCSSSTETPFLSRNEKSPPTSPNREGSAEWAMLNNHTGIASKRPNRWSHKSDAPSHDTLDSNSGTSGGWATTLWRASGRKSINDMPGEPKHRRHGSKSHRQKAKRKKSSILGQSFYASHKAVCFVL